GIACPSTRGFLLTLALVGCCAAILRMSANAGLMSIRPMSLAEFVNPFRNPAAWILVAIWIVVVLTHGWNDFQASWWLQTISVARVWVIRTCCDSCCEYRGSPPICLQVH